MLWTTENVFNITKVKPNRVWMCWLTPAVRHSGKLKQKLWVQDQPGLCSHLLLQNSPSLPKVNLVWNGKHDTILIMSNTKTKPKNLHVGTWACEMARWVTGFPEFSLGNPMLERERLLWAQVTLFYESREERATVALGRVSLFSASTPCLQWGRWITRWKGTAHLPAA